MSNTWGHDLWRLETAMEQWPSLARRDYRGNPEAHTCSNGLRCPGKHRVTYTFEGLRGPIEHQSTVGADAEFYASYTYVTGRGGNTTRRDLFYCQPCAMKYAARNGLKLPMPLGAAS